MVSFLDLKVASTSAKLKTEKQKKYKFYNFVFCKEENPEDRFSLKSTKKRRTDVEPMVPP